MGTRGPDGEPTSPAHKRDAHDIVWERLQERLGAPDDPWALRRARELAEAGWELLGISFASGMWVFRRKRHA